MWQTLPLFGTGVLYAILIACAYTFAVSIGAGRGNPRLLQSARLGAYGTCGLILFGVLLLAYAFVTHDFRIQYVARYSERSMSLGYLLSALWGGQDGSLLWWTFLLAIYVSSCVRWLKGRYRELQPYVIATLMIIIAFFAVLMIFSANPFSTSISGVARVDGEGLNPLLRNFYMIIHPPSLYTGFVGCSIPFAFAIAALVTGRLDNEWIVAARKWMLFAWLFLTIGNALGMLWAYEELGWGGYWAWDPVENAACLPWFTASAYVHSTMIQERRNMLKTWNLFLICLTFFLTIFGTFLTRSGLIASVHSFAQSNIGIFFVYFMLFIFIACAVLLIWRLVDGSLSSGNQIEAIASREAAFVINNWALLGMMTFIAVATLFPKISEWLWQQAATVGPRFFNFWLAPFAVLVFALMGLAPLFGWRKTSSTAMMKAFIAPGIAFVGAAVLHLALGKALGFPAIVPYDGSPMEMSQLSGPAGAVIRALHAIAVAFHWVAPLVVVSLSAFNVAVIVQEFTRGTQARMRSTEDGALSALITLVVKNRRRYGGYIVHFGIVFMFIGFVGRAWGIDSEASMLPGDKHQIGAYELTYKGPRMEVDVEKRMIFADVEVSRGGSAVTVASPAKYIYKKGGTPTTEVSITNTLRDDLYMIVGSVSPQSKRATFEFHVNPLVSWIWVGVVFMMIGAGISLFPELQLKEVRVWRSIQAAAGVASGIMFALFIAWGPTHTHGELLDARSKRRAAAAAPDAPLPTPPLPAGLILAPIAGLALGGLATRRRKKRSSEPRS